jgi:hypothetical protein
MHAKAWWCACVHHTPAYYSLLGSAFRHQIEDRLRQLNIRERHELDPANLAVRRVIIRADERAFGLVLVAAIETLHGRSGPNCSFWNTP